MDYSDHPCFNSEARRRTARIHLPVAPKCNVQCNYCDRRFDCVNESRPGVASALLTPSQAAHYLDRALERMPNIAVTGIAGPGDPFASPQETLETLSLVRSRHPDMTLCVATNGLNVEPFAGEIARLRVSHVTVTVNSIEASIGAQIYAWVRDGYRIYRGAEGALLLWTRQRSAIAALKRLNVTVKVNMVVVPGVNEECVSPVAQEMAALGVDVMNCVPLYPVENTPFAEKGSLAPGRLEAIRTGAAAHLPQMNHCARCRADAAGMLGEAQPAELVELLRSTASGSLTPGDNRPYVAVASMEGLLVNEHLGHASELWIIDPAADAPVVVGKRETPEPGGGVQRWYEMADLLADCHALFVAAAGSTPRRVLERSGVRVFEAAGLLADVVREFRDTGGVRRQAARAPGGCKGAALGCG